MDYDTLFLMQKDLNDTIYKECGLSEKDLEHKQFLALMVEIGEFANETRCFKYWSKKDPSEKWKTLEEYVDILHFILTVGLRYRHHKLIKHYSLHIAERTDLTRALICLYESVLDFRKAPSIENYLNLWMQFLSVGKVAGFNENDIYDAYVIKNKVNYERQAEGY